MKQFNQNTDFKNRGFTLAELLGVIVLLSLLMLLVFPTIINQMKEGKSQISSAVEQLIFNSAGNYIDGNLNQYPVSNNTTYCFTLQQLVDAGEISQEILIDENGKLLDLNKKVEVKIENRQKKYQMNDQCNI